MGGLGYHFDFAWSKDSSFLAYFINPFDQDLSSPIMLHLPPSTVHVLDVMNGNSKQIYSDFSILGDLSWYSNSEELLMTRLRIGFCYNEDKSTSCVQSVRLSDGFVTTLAKFNGLQQHLYPKLCPDGLQVSLLYCAESDLFNWMLSLGTVESHGKGDTKPIIKRLTTDLKLEKAKWSKDGQKLFALRNYGPYDQIYTINIQTGQLKQITNAPMNIQSFEISHDGSKLAWRGKDAHGSHIIRFAFSDGTQLQDLVVQPEYNEVFALSEVQEIEWETIDYPSKMRGLLLLPNHYKKGTSYPLVIDIHGGGAGRGIYLAGAILTDSPLEWQLWTAKGYAVFVPEFRSSAAFGFLAISRDFLQKHDIINCDMIDVIAGLDELVNLGLVDNNRVAVIGSSAGGRRVNWFTVASNRFKVVISKEGWADEWLDNMKYPAFWPQFGGSPNEVPENYLRNSALFHSKGASTPTLFLMGNPMLGGVDPDKTVHKLYEALKEHGVETEYIEYLDEGHNFILPKNREDALDKAMEWIDRYIK